MEVAYSCESLVLPLSETHFFTIHIISIRVSREEGRIEGERTGRIEGEQLYLIKQIIKRIIKNSKMVKKHHASFFRNMVFFTGIFL